jgi:hypothetical protein
MRLLLVALLATWGCAKPAPTPAPVPAEASNGFIKISLDDEQSELDDLVGSELMVLTADCGDLIALEPMAMLGKLDGGQVRCLETALDQAQKQTTMDKLSRVLMADAYAKGDMHRWESVVARHLDMVDRSDPDLVYKFASHLAKQDVSRAKEAIRWSDVALENRSYWTGDTHVTRVNALYKIRAASAQQIWAAAEQKYIDSATDANEQERTDRRNEAKTYAREWLEYARSSGKDTTLALQLCISAAGSEEYCAASQ